MWLKDKVLKLNCPTRIDLTGGFTDVAPFRNERVAYHINLGIELRIFVTFKLRNDRELYIASSCADMEKGTIIQLDTTVPHILISHLLQKTPLPYGLDISICSEAPVGAGLGTSGALAVTLLAGLRILQNDPGGITDIGRLAMDAVEIENSVGMLGGCQDEFAAVSGNIHMFSFHGVSWNVLPIKLSAQKLKVLESHLIVAYPGGKRISGDIVRAVMSAYKKGDLVVSNALDSLNRYALEMEKALIHFDMKELVRLVRKIRSEQQKLHPHLIDKKTERVIARLEEDSHVGVKLLGGGGPGACMLVACKSDRQFSLSHSLLKEAGYHLLPVNVANKGLQFTLENI